MSVTFEHTRFSFHSREFAVEHEVVFAHLDGLTLQVVDFLLCWRGVCERYAALAIVVVAGH